MSCVYCDYKDLQKVGPDNDLSDQRLVCNRCMEIQPDIAKTDQEIIDHLVKGLHEIIDLKNRTQFRDGLTQVVKRFKKAASIARKCLDTMPRRAV